MTRNHEPRAVPHRRFSRPRPIAGAPARHCLHGRGGVRVFDHGFAAETPVRALRTAANLLSTLHLVLAVPVAAPHVAAYMGDAASEKCAAASFSRRARH